MAKRITGKSKATGSSKAKRTGKSKATPAKTWRAGAGAHQADGADRGGFHRDSHGPTPWARKATLFGFSATAALKALGKAGYTVAEARLIVAALATGEIKPSSIVTAVNDGRSEVYSAGAAGLTTADLAQADRACGRVKARKATPAKRKATPAKRKATPAKRK